MTASTSSPVWNATGTAAGTTAAAAGAHLRLRAFAAAVVIVRANLPAGSAAAADLDRAARHCRAAAALAEAHPGALPPELLAVIDAIGECARLTALGIDARRTELLRHTARAEQTLTRWSLARPPADRGTELGDALRAAVHAFLTVGFPPPARR